MTDDWDRHLDVRPDGGIGATCDCEAQMVMVEFYRKGTAVLLTYSQAAAIRRLLEQTLQRGWPRRDGKEV